MHLSFRWDGAKILFHRSSSSNRLGIEACANKQLIHFMSGACCVCFQMPKINQAGPSRQVHRYVWKSKTRDFPSGTGQLELFEWSCSPQACGVFQSLIRNQTEPSAARWSLWQSEQNGTRTWLRCTALKNREKKSAEQQPAWLVEQQEENHTLYKPAVERFIGVPM